MRARAELSKGSVVEGELVGRVVLARVGVGHRHRDVETERGVGVGEFGEQRGAFVDDGSVVAVVGVDLQELRVERRTLRRGGGSAVE